MASRKFPHTFPMVGNILLTNYVQLLLYISYEQSDLYMLVTTRAFLEQLQGQGECKQTIAIYHQINTHTTE